MVKPGDSFKTRLKALRDEYRQLLPVKIKEIETTWLLSWQSPDKRDDMLSELYRQAHSLAGSGTTFGYSGISAIASEMETFIKTLTEEQVPLTELQHKAILNFLSRMRRSAGEPEEPEDMEKLPEPESRQNRSRQQSLYWLGLDHEFSEDVLNQLPIFGFHVAGFTNLEGMRDAVAQQMPELVVFDLATPEGPFPDTGTVFEFLNTLKDQTRVICILPPETDLVGRLAAVRSGACCSLIKPVPFDTLLGRLDTLSPAHPERPYRLFIIDDDPSLTTNTATIMRRAGMVVESANDPLTALDALVAFDPDLILLDLHMPQCSGIELARIINQDDRFFGVAIVYLSQEKELNHQLEALEAGAEDFLLKPVKYRYLYHSLACRMRRARHQRRQRTHDGLTGLLNHTSFQQTVSSRVARGASDGIGFVLAFLDLDHFSEINDSHGHRVGDRVLHTLAVMLRRGFGNRVTLSRYASNTFALLLPHTDERRAHDILSSLRDEFARLKHRGNIGHFTVKLSYGLAEFPLYANVTELTHAAAEALRKSRLPVPQPMADAPVLAVENLPSVDEDETLFIDDDDFETVDVEPDADIALDNDGEKAQASLEENQNDNIRTEDRTIVVVDDDRQVLSVIVSFLESQGFSVHGAVTGDEGYETAKRVKPDLMLIDLLLFPGIHGFELCKMVKDDTDLDGLKIILMTAVYKDYRYRVEGREAGGDAFIIKPINFDQLMEKINSLTHSPEQV